MGRFSYERVMEYVSLAGIVSLLAIMFIIDANVVYRLTGGIIAGTYEMVELVTAICVGFSLLYAELKRSFVTVDLLVSNVPRNTRRLWHYIGQTLSVVYWSSMIYGMTRITFEKAKLGEYTHTLKVPVVPVRGLWTISLILVLVTLVYRNFMFENVGQADNKEKVEDGR